MYHLQMSKKIAQLTKVVYHLNTKNEEHDGDLATQVLVFPPLGEKP